MHIILQYFISHILIIIDIYATFFFTIIPIILDIILHQYTKLFTYYLRSLTNFIIAYLLDYIRVAFNLINLLKIYVIFISEGIYFIIYVINW